MKGKGNPVHHRKTHQKNEEIQKKNSNGSMKIKWTSSEDEKLIKAVEKYHHKNWKSIANEVSTRSPKQCLERWYGMLDPSLIKTEFTPEEDQTIIDMQNRLGNKWTLIAECLPGRSAISVRNRSDLLKRHARNPSLSKIHKETNLDRSSSFSLNVNKTFNNDFQQNLNLSSDFGNPIGIKQADCELQCDNKEFEDVKPQNELLEIFQKSDIQNYFSGNSWIELDRFFSNIDDLMFWNQSELFL